MLFGAFGRPCGVRPMSRYWSLGPWPASAANSGAKIATSAMSTMTTNETIAARSRRSRSQASRQGLRPWIRGAPRARWRPVRRDRDRACRGRRCCHCTSSPPRPGRVERQVGREVLDRGLGQREQSRRRPAGSGRRHAVLGGRRARGQLGVVGDAARPAPSGSAGGTGSPTAASTGEGRSPRRTIRSRLASASGSGDGHGRQQRAGVGVAGVLVQSPRRPPTSTILPRYITAIRSLTCRTTDRSCEMNT